MLTFPIKDKWFQMIVARIKPEEYRAFTPYYSSRLGKYEGKCIQVIFRNGYSRKSPSALCEVTPIIRQGGSPEWGADENVIYWVMIIHSVKKL